MDLVFEYLLFAAKLLTVLLAVAVPLVLVVLVRGARRADAGTHLEIHNLNEARANLRAAMESAILRPKEAKARAKTRKSERKAAAKADARPRSFVCRFDGDLRASAADTLRDEVTAILDLAEPDDEVIVVLESGGGTVHGYGLAASQLQRIRNRGLRLCVVVDRIAASGGYMMACVGDELVAAPFAIIGSIGVVAQLPNFNRLLKKHDIDFEQITAGEHKRTLTLFGENSDEDRQKFQSEIDDAHALFKTFVTDHRPQLDISRVATGEWWFGTRALELGLVDRLETSDDVISKAIQTRDVHLVRARPKAGVLQRLRERAMALLGASKAGV